MHLFVLYLVICFLAATVIKNMNSKGRTALILGFCVSLSAAYYFGDQLSLPQLSFLDQNSTSVADVEGNSNSDSHDLNAEVKVGKDVDVAINKSNSNQDQMVAGLTESRELWSYHFQQVKDYAMGIIGSLTASNVTTTVLRTIGWVLYFAGLAAILYRPRYGIYLIVCLTLVGDAVLMPWYPFVKGFSSRESIFFIHDFLIVSPMETYLVITFVSWFGRQLRQPRHSFYSGPLFWPAIVFLAFVAFGLIYGITTGGNINVALWEARPIFYLAPMLVITSNIINTPTQMSNLIWIAMVALFIEGLAATLYFFLELNADLSQIQSTNEHSAAVHLNTLFVLILGVWIYRASLAKRVILPLMVPFVIFGYIAMQRRAAFLSLAIVVGLMGIVLYHDRRRLFWRLVPIMILLGTAYVVGFWNNNSSLALPVQAVKSVIVSNQAGDEDRRSNDYRLLEDQNISYTIHQHPLTGVGFGQKFYIIAPMPDISWFIWWEYITHNSIVWIWMKTGVTGFLAMTFLVGTAVMVGVQTLFLLTTPDLKAIALTATLFIMMHFIFAYADMSWDSQSMIYVGAMMGLLNGLNRMADPSEA